MSDNWTQEELEGAVKAYLDMRSNEMDGTPFTKKEYYKLLAEEYGRTKKAYEYRMQNISFVFSTMGRRWVTGLKPAKNVGVRVANDIEGIINKLEGNADSNISSFAAEVSSRRSKKSKTKPKGNKRPRKLQRMTTYYERDPEVVAWVVEQANGRCEACGNSAPFEKDDGSLFLEVHHLRNLSDSGSDTIDNAVALCPNCHRELHYGKNRLGLMEAIYARIDRLVEE